MYKSIQNVSYPRSEVFKLRVDKSTKESYSKYPNVTSSLNPPPRALGLPPPLPSTPKIKYGQPKAHTLALKPKNTTIPHVANFLSVQ